MKSKTIPILFVIIAAILAGAFFVIRYFFAGNDDSLTRAKIVTLGTKEETDSDENRKLSMVEAEKYETFVPLYSNETLISTLTFDFSNDGYDDEVIVVRKVGSDNLWIIPGLYNSETGSYTRVEQIPTPFSRTRTFSYSGMDLIGDHTNALIYQGLDDDGNYVMEIFMCRSYSSKKLVFENIGSFSSDGTVFIQQTDRSDNYELGISKGESYSVWVYKSDIPENATEEQKSAASLNQIQQEYTFNNATGQYELNREIKVTAGRIAAKELSRIQDGTVETFADFLDGLWYKKSNDDNKIRYLYFDYATKEIIQLIGDTQEVYEWEDSKLRHNGIYLTTVNSDIINLHRRFDISLVNIDEIRLTLRDDINLSIKQNSQWDGEYKKMNMQSSFNETAKNTEIDVFATELNKQNSWATADTSAVILFKDGEFILQNNEITETGIYSLLKVGTYNVIQFRSDSDYSYLEPSYSMEFGTKVITETIKRKTVEKTITDYDSITFTPIKFTPTDCFAAEGRILNLSRE